MAKRRFFLNHNNQPIRTLDDLIQNCDPPQLVIDYREGKLKRWLEALRTFDNLIQAIDQISSQNDLDVAKELVEILEIETKILENYQHSRKFFESGNKYYELEEYEMALADYSQAIQFDANYTEAINGRDTTIAEIRKAQEKAKREAEIRKAQEKAKREAEIRKAQEKAKREAEEKKRRLITSKADFNQLNQYLAEGKWKEADQETANIMLKIMGRESEGWLTSDNCKNFPREELKIIDSLWVKYSNGKFGFSVQKKIWIECGGKVGVYDWDIYRKFAVKIGWRKGDNWLNYSELTFNTNAPQAHLPAGGAVQAGGVGYLFSLALGVSLFSFEGVSEGISFLFSRL